MRAALLSWLRTTIEVLGSDLQFMRQNIDKSSRSGDKGDVGVKSAGCKDEYSVFLNKETPRLPKCIRFDGFNNFDNVSDLTYDKDESTLKQIDKPKNKKIKYS